MLCDIFALLARCFVQSVVPHVAECSELMNHIAYCCQIVCRVNIDNPISVFPNAYWLILACRSDGPLEKSKEPNKNTTWVHCYKEPNPVHA